MSQQTAARAAILADDWERICRTPLWHAAGCRCTGGAGCLPVDPASTEADLLESLANRARLTDDPCAAALVLERLRNARGVDAVPFSDWIRGLPDSGLSGASVDGLLANIERFVDSLRAPVEGRRTYTHVGDLS